jgi:predicted outer membrane protein
MLRRTLLLAAAAAPAAGFAASEARAQANIVPDPTPRLPPQPGQGLPLEDSRFLRDAVALSAVQAEAAGLAAERAGDEETRRLAAGLAERHRRMAEQVRGLARARGVAVDTPETGEGGAAGGPPAQAKRRLEVFKAASAPGGGDTGRDFLAAQIDVHPVLVEMYQTQASHTTDRELGRFAITTLVGLQEDFAAATRLGERHGLQRRDRLLANPPQYGPGAGPPR